MKRYSAVIIITAVVCCLLLAGEAAFFTARMRMGLESLADAVNENGPGKVNEYAGALIGASPSGKSAEKGRAALKASGYSSLPVDHYMSRLVPDGVYYGIFAAAILVIGGSALFLAAGRRRRIKYEEELTRRVNAALKGEEPFKAGTPDERVIAKLFSQVDRANALRADSADEIRKYVENVAHEIKSPTSGILLNLDLMERGGMTEERLSAARECAARIDAYTAGLLSLARLRAGKVRMEFESADMIELVRETAAELEANGIRAVVSGESVTVNCDRVRVKEAVRNLIVNAEKHMENADPVRVTVSSTEKDVSITVFDNGPGVRSGALIERYAVGSDDGTSFGIGLSLAKETAVRHSGKLVIKNPDNGSAVELVFPRFSLKTSITE